ncbi:DUF58 domain-containing protein [Flaviaesturariibacter amylovorans]|uniref:DUF58 domain-containing protein n=1 Tax=Flaviaesturariibacter amylovorans TaxID=1084520 RepID=A0ABP8GY48_9BACT
MKTIKRFIDRTSFFPTHLVYYTLMGAAALFVLSFWFPYLFTMGMLALLFIGLAVLVDTLMLFGRKKGFDAWRRCPERFSIGDDNPVALELENEYGFAVRCTIIDELPYQFQARRWRRHIRLAGGDKQTLSYKLRPLQRGEYGFGSINVFVQSPLGFVSRRYSFEQEEVVKVYPSFLQVRRYQLLAAANRLQEAGIKRQRALGHSLEFEQIKEYVVGDDYRTVNWKATARRGDLMVNNFTDERSQQVYCIVNKGRAMKMPFEGMTLLDYAINAALVLSNVALQRQDKAGLITFAQKTDTFLAADKRPGQFNGIMEALYKQETTFLDVDFEKLFAIVRNRITQRSLLVLFTNFESFESLERELPSLQRMAHYHLLVVVFFENTELKGLRDKPAKTMEDIYIKTIADKFAHEKRLIVKELRKHGIIALLTTPENLTVQAINKYLEVKNRQSI